MYYCDECKIESINRGYTKPCDVKCWIYEKDGGKCDRCGKKADVFKRPEMEKFVQDCPVVKSDIVEIGLKKEFVSWWNGLPDDWCEDIAKEIALRSYCAAKSSICEWSYNENDDCWSTSCGREYTINEGSPAENNMLFCHSCGGKLLNMYNTVAEDN